MRVNTLTPYEVADNIDSAIAFLEELNIILTRRNK